jgi:Fe-Mn family superoxide dismutase
LYGPGSDGTIGDAIVKRWDSISKFLEEFSKEATENFGSGWRWLAKQRNDLAFVNTSNARNPLVSSYQPLFTVDFW